MRHPYGLASREMREGVLTSAERQRGGNLQPTQIVSGRSRRRHSQSIRLVDRERAQELCGVILVKAARSPRVSPYRVAGPITTQSARSAVRFRPQAERGR